MSAHRNSSRLQEDRLGCSKYIHTDRRLTPSFRWQVWTIYIARGGSGSLRDLNVNKVWQKEDLIQQLRDTVTSAAASSSLHCNCSDDVRHPKALPCPTIDFTDIYIVVFTDGINSSNNFHSYYRYKVNLVSFYNSYFGDDFWYLELESELGKLLDLEIVPNGRLIVVNAILNHKDHTLRIRFQGDENGADIAHIFRIVAQNESPTGSTGTVSPKSNQSDASYKTARESQAWMGPNDSMDNIMAQLSSQPMDVDEATDAIPTTRRRRRSPSLYQNSEDYPLIVLDSDSE